MHHIHVNFYVHAPREKVFEAFSDHERFFRGGGIRSARLARTGTPDRNGLGALREIQANGMRFAEEITCFERPQRFDYKIIECTIPVSHRGGRLDFLDRGAGTEIDWTSDFEIPIPVLGKFLGGLFQQLFAAEFTRLALQAKKELEG